MTKCCVYWIKDTTALCSNCLHFPVGRQQQNNFIACARSCIDHFKITETATDTKDKSHSFFLLQIRNKRFRDFWQRRAYTGLDGARVFRTAQIMSSNDRTVQQLHGTRHVSTDYALFSSEVCSPSDPIVRLVVRFYTRTHARTIDRSRGQKLVL